MFFFFLHFKRNVQLVFVRLHAYEYLCIDSSPITVSFCDV